MLVSASITSGTSQVTTSNLRFGTNYYWRVRARHDADTSSWSPLRFFSTIDQIFLVSPTNGATSQAPNEILDWSALSGITFYDYQWDTTALFNSPLLVSASITSGTSQVTTSNLRFGTPYYWRVRGRHTTDTSAWSFVRFFTTVDQIFQVSPANAATNVGTNPLLDWTALSGILNYQYQLDTLFNFSTGITQTVAGGTSQASTSGLLNGRIYYWRVRAWHAADTTNWSTIRSFGVGVASIVSPLFTQVGPYCNGESIAALPSSSLNGVSGSWSPAINNTQTTTYTFIPNASQSAAATTLTITIKQSSAAVDVKSACTSYQWINGITYTQSTNTPTFILTNAAGCDSIVTLNLTISTVGIDVQPISETTVENSEVIFTVNSTSPTANFQWQLDDGSGFSNIANGGQFSGTTSNTLTVTGVTFNNNNQQYRCIVSSGTCSSTSEIATLTVEGIVGLNGSDSEPTVHAYPNPVSDILYLRSVENQHGTKFNVFDNTGRSVLSGVISSNIQPIEMNELPSGLYFIVLENQSFKVIKQ